MGAIKPAPSLPETVEIIWLVLRLALLFSRSSRPLEEVLVVLMLKNRCPPDGDNVEGFSSTDLSLDLSSEDLVFSKISSGDGIIRVEAGPGGFDVLLLELFLKLSLVPARGPPPPGLPGFDEGEVEDEECWVGSEEELKDDLWEGGGTRYTVDDSARAATS